MQNLAAVLHKTNDLRVEPFDLPKVGPQEVKVAIRSVGICGSDVHYLQHGKIGPFIVNQPMVLGHESAGVIVELGSGVKDFEVGDRVALEPGIPCRYCKFCKTGRYNLCRDVEFLATPPVHGSMAQFVSHPSDFCFKLPEHVSFDEGAMLEPLSVAVHACNRGGVAAGKTLLIIGAGPIGLACLLVAQAYGVSKVMITDINKSRLEAAKGMGAYRTFCVGESPSLEECVTTGEIERADISIEASGSTAGVRSAIQMTEAGGVVVLVGLGAPEINIPIIDASTREVDIRGVFRYANTYATALDLVSSGKVDVKPLITHHFPLEQAVEAFDTAKSGADGVIKVAVTVQ